MRPPELDVTKNQMPLFGGPPATRRIPDRALIAAAGDPATSHAAAREISKSGHRESQKRAVVEFLRAQPAPLTSAEIAVASGFGRYDVARRLPDAERDQLVTRGPVRTCKQTGRAAISWRAI
jgi:hypothetical protein